MVQFMNLDFLFLYLSTVCVVLLVSFFFSVKRIEMQ